MSRAHSCLFEEHLLLGAQFETDEEGRERVASYPFAHAEFQVDRTYLMDMEGHPFAYAHGQLASSFISCVSASALPDVDSIRPSLLLSGTGGVLSLPFIARAAADEYVIFDYSSRADTTFSWLSFVQAIEEGGSHPFQALQLEHEIPDLIPLGLVGTGAAAIIQDYLGSHEQAPFSLTLKSYRFDGTIPVLVFSFSSACYLLFVPRARARILWRSLLSHTELAPTAPKNFKRVLAQVCPRLARMDAAPDLDDLSSIPELSTAALRADQLIRNDTNFIGARSLQHV